MPLSSLFHPLPVPSKSIAHWSHRKLNGILRKCFVMFSLKQLKNQTFSCFLEPLFISSKQNFISRKIIAWLPQQQEHACAVQPLNESIIITISFEFVWCRNTTWGNENWTENLYLLRNCKTYKTNVRIHMNLPHCKQLWIAIILLGGC